MTVSDIWMARRQGQIFQANLFNNARSMWPRTTKFDRITRGDGCISSGQPCSNRKGAGPSASQFWGFPYIYAHTLWHWTTKFLVVTHTGRGLFYWSATPHLKGASQALPNFGVPFYLCLPLCRRTIKFDVVTHVRQMRVSWGQPRLPSKESKVPALPNFRVLLYYAYILKRRTTKFGC